MKSRIFRIQTKLLAGFFLIVILAGIAGVTGLKGITEINIQNEISMVVDELSELANRTQAASLRYVIYEELRFHELAMESAAGILDKAQQLKKMSAQGSHLEDTMELIRRVEDYQELIGSYKEKETRLQEIQEIRKTSGLHVVAETEKLIMSLVNRSQTAASGNVRRETELAISELQALLSGVNALRTTALNYSSAKSIEGRERIAEDWLQELDVIFKGYDAIDPSLLRGEEAYNLKTIVSSLSGYTQNVEEYHRVMSDLWNEQYKQRDMAGRVTEQIEIVRAGVQDDIDRAERGARRAIVISLCAAVLLSLIIAVTLSRNITVPLTEGINVARNIAAGRLDNIALNLTRKDELGELGSSLDIMAHSLQTQRWAEKGKQALDDELRGHHELNILSEKFIALMTKHLDGVMGAFYAFDGTDTLELLSSYAFSDRPGNFSRITLGEGFIGQGAKERKTLFFSRLNEEAPLYNYGAGEERPGHYMVSPLVFKDELIAVILIASEKGFSEDHKTFIDQNMGNVAVLFNAAKSRETISQLLLNAQQQQEELRQTNEELEKQSSALLESEAELQAQQEELRVTNEELEEQTQALQQQRDSVRLKNDELEKARNEVEKKAADLEKASRYKSEFLANMSHELRTPLNSILILSKLLTENSAGNLNEKQLKSADAIHSSGSDLLNLINEILDLSKVEAGKIDLHIDTLNVQSVLDDLHRVFSDSALQKGLELILSVGPRVSQTIRTDGHRLQQILRNLLTNAIKFTEKGSVSLEIFRPESPWKGLSPDQYLKMEVRDTGIGISKEKQSSVFEAFKQADGSTMRKYGGTGLGLSISRELTKLLGGTLVLESEIGKGSCFTLTIPVGSKDEGEGALADDDDPSRTVRESAPSSAEKEKKKIGEAIVFEDSDIDDDRNSLGEGDKVILIIEDDSNFVNVLADLVRDKGYKVLIAEDGETGLHFADYYRPDAIILDIGLPGIDGWTVMERLKGNADLRHIPVHFMSGREDDLQAMKMGAVGYLTKPVSLDELNGALDKIDSLTGSRVSSLLIVEDDDIQRESIRELIGDGDIHIRDVASGKDAFDALQESYYDCMILDLGLKDMTGFELLEKINEDGEGFRTPIIIYTGRDLTMEENAMLNRYSKSVIIKGIKSPERLLDETSLFLHRVESDLPEEKRNMIKTIHSAESTLEGKTILVVDDDMRNVFALNSILEEKGMSVIIARDGLESLEKLESENAVDLVLMDIMMPKMDGYEAMRQIRKKRQFKSLPIIALTAKAMRGDRNKCIEAGASDYLAKPVDMEKLISMLRVWLY